jgi:signal transduction histidine kinase
MHWRAPLKWPSTGRALTGDRTYRASFLLLAPSLVVVVGLAVAGIITWLGVAQLRAQSDDAAALRGRVLSETLAERLRATALEDRAAVVEQAARRSGAEILLVDQSGRVVVDSSLGAPSTEDLVELLIEGDGERTTRLGRTRFHATTLASPLEHLSLITFVRAPERPYATGSLVGSVAALTVVLISAAALVAFAFARGVHADVTYVSERITEMATEALSPSGKMVPVRDVDQVGLLTSAFNVLVERFTAAERAYRQDLAGALESDRDRSEFLAALSHELRTPLNAILGFADVLLSEVDGPLSDEGRENVTVLRGSAQHLRSLIDDILDLSALESGELTLDRSEVNVYAIAAEVVREARVTAQTKLLSVELAGERALAWADPRRLRQIIGNVVSNAVKFTATGFVRVEVQPRGEFAAIVIEDTGPGIAPDQQAAIFEEYRQVGAPSQSRTGVGLGLAITRRLVRMHDGQILLESEIGRGSTFTILLPKEPVAERTSRFISSAPPPSRTARGFGLLR